MADFGGTAWEPWADHVYTPCPFLLHFVWGADNIMMDRRVNTRTSQPQMYITNELLVGRATERGAARPRVHGPNYRKQLQRVETIHDKQVLHGYPV